MDELAVLVSLLAGVSAVLVNFGLTSVLSKFRRQPHSDRLEAELDAVRKEFAENERKIAALEQLIAVRDSKGQRK